MKITAREFFLELGAMAALYAGVIALLNLLFRVINTAFPQIQNGYQNYYYAGNPISFPVATLIIVTPLFLVLNWYMHKNPSERDGSFRKWLVYITLFIAGLMLAGDLITLLYQFIDGQELTTGFLLKILAVLVVAGSVFGYFIQSLRGTLDSKTRMAWRLFAALLVIGSIVAGFRVIGSPATQRAYRYDAERVMNLQSIQSQITYYWQQKGFLPASVEAATDSLSGWSIPLDPVTKAPMEYSKLSDLSFRLCANFEKPNAPYMGYDMGNEISMTRPAMYDGGIKGGNNWDHQAGRQCFDRTIDPQLYPAIKR